MSFKEYRNAMGRPCGQEVGCSVFANSESNQSIFAGSRGILTLIAAWQAMEAAIRVRRVSSFSTCRCSAVGDGEDLFKHAFELAAFEADGSGLDGERARAEGLGFEAVAVELFGDGSEGDHLGGEEFDEDGHEEALTLDAFGGALAHDFFEEDAFVGDVLVDDPEALFVDGEDEGVAELTEGLEGGEEWRLRVGSPSGQCSSNGCSPQWIVGGCCVWGPDMVSSVADFASRGRRSDCRSRVAGRQGRGDGRSGRC